mgnify:CR=1 FL=1|jgi:hypothetical protein
MMAEKVDYSSLSEADLDQQIETIYAEEASRFDSTVAELFDMTALRNWFRSGFPATVDGMSKGMIRFAMIPLIEQGLVQEPV